MKQINICALGPLRVNNACVNEGVLAYGTKLAIITSQAGSTEWRSTQNKDKGGNYDHHMSRAAWYVCCLSASCLTTTVTMQLSFSTYCKAYLRLLSQYFLRVTSLKFPPSFLLCPQNSNMAGALLAEELRSKGISVIMLHPEYIFTRSRTHTLSLCH